MIMERGRGRRMPAGNKYYLFIYVTVRSNSFLELQITQRQIELPDNFPFLTMSDIKVVQARSEQHISMRILPYLHFLSQFRLILR